MVTFVIELADELYKAHQIYLPFGAATIAEGHSSRMMTYTVMTATLSCVCSNANDIGLPLSVVQQLLKGTDYEQLLP